MIAVTNNFCNFASAIIVPVVQWIEQQFPKLLIRVRFPAGIQDKCFHFFTPPKIKSGVKS